MFQLLFRFLELSNFHVKFLLFFPHMVLLIAGCGCRLNWILTTAAWGRVWPALVRRLYGPQCCLQGLLESLPASCLESLKLLLPTLFYLLCTFHEVITEAQLAEEYKCRTWLHLKATFHLTYNVIESMSKTGLLRSLCTPWCFLLFYWWDVRAMFTVALACRTAFCLSQHWILGNLGKHRLLRTDVLSCDSGCRIT